MAANAPRERVNWLIHMNYVQQDYDRCLKLIEEQLKLHNGLCEYPIYIKGAHVSLYLSMSETCPHVLCRPRRAALRVFRAAQR